MSEGSEKIKILFGKPEDVSLLKGWFDGKKFSFPFTVTIPGKGAEYDKSTKHQITVSISGTLLQTRRYKNDSDIQKVLFEFAKLKVETKIKENRLSVNESLDLHTGNASERKPYDPSKISDPNGYSFDIDIKQQKTKAVEKKGTGKLNKVFISYAREDIETARRLCDDLRKAGADTWLDDDELIPGQNWKTEITKAIKKSRHFIALLSTNSVEKRGFVQTELKEAVKVLSEIPSKNIFIIPVRIDDCGIPDELTDFHCADLFPDYKKGFNKILRAIPGRQPDNDSIPSDVYKLRNEPKMVSGTYNGNSTVTHKVTSLMWQKPYAESEMKLKSKPTHSVSEKKQEEKLKTERKRKQERLKWKPAVLSLLLIFMFVYGTFELIQVLIITEVKDVVYKLRSEPQELSSNDVATMFEKHNFFASNFKSGEFKNELIDNGDGTITDAVTGLMWQQSESDNSMTYDETYAYIDGLNGKKFADYNDWRLPTLEELASLLENKLIKNRYIDPVFDCKRYWHWTADKRASGGAWYVNFHDSRVSWDDLVNLYYMRAVRSLTTEKLFSSTSIRK